MVVGCCLARYDGFSLRKMEWNLAFQNGANVLQCAGFVKSLYKCDFICYERSMVAFCGIFSVIAIACVGAVVNNSCVCHILPLSQLGALDKWNCE